MFAVLPISAITVSGIQIAEVFVCLAFLAEFLLLRRLRLLIFWAVAVLVGVAVGGVSASAFSQVIKALLIPILAHRLTSTRNELRLLPPNPKRLTMLNIVFLFVCLCSAIFNIRLTNQFYIDSNSGVFRHSVDFAFFVLMAFYALQFERKLFHILFVLLAIPAVLLGGSRTVLLLLPILVLLNRPLFGLYIAIFAFVSMWFFSDTIIGQLPEKIGGLLSLLIAADFSTILQDGSLDVRVSNFSLLFAQMDLIHWVLGFPRELVLKITTDASAGDVSTDNIFFYKIIFFGVPFGLIIVCLNLLAIRILANNYPILLTLCLYGMLQDWLSNAFCILVLYITLLAVKRTAVNQGGHVGTNTSSSY